MSAREAGKGRPIYSTLLPELASDMSRWVQYLRMDIKTFEKLLCI